VNRPQTPAGGYHNYFGPQAGRYREYRPRYPAALFHYLAVAGGGTRLAWDCATGNGQAAVRLAERFARVVATDPSDEMIALAMPHPRVAYSVAKYESGLPDKSANLVTVAQALHWFDVDPFYSKCTVDSYVDEIVDLFYSVTLGPFWPKERRHVDEGYRAIALPLDEMAPPPFEMIEQWSLSDFVSYIRTWSAVYQFIETRGEEPVLAFEDALAAMWGDPLQRKRVRWPVHCRIGEIR
jgi:SAM-dependent methyltransferase